MLQVLWSKIFWIIGATIVAALAVFLYTKFTHKDTYTSEIQLYTVMESREDSSTQEVTTAQINIRRSVAALYVKAIKKQDSLDKMAKALRDQDGYDISASQLGRLISAYIDSDASEIIHVRARTLDKELSYRICRIVGDEAGELVGDAYVGCTVAIFNNPRPPAGPDSSGIARNTVIGALAGFVVSAAVVIIMYLLDRSVKNGEELETASGVRYLGEIPDFAEVFKDGGKHYGGYGSSRGSGAQ